MNIRDDRGQQRPLCGSPVSVEGTGKYEVLVAVVVEVGTGSFGEMTMRAFRGAYRGLHHSEHGGDHAR